MRFFLSVAFEREKKKKCSQIERNDAASKEDSALKNMAVFKTKYTSKMSERVSERAKGKQIV